MYKYIYIYMFYSNKITKSIINDNNLIIMKTYVIRYACLISYSNINTLANTQIFLVNNSNTENLILVINKFQI